MNLLKKCRYGLMLYNNSDVWIGRSLQTYGEFSESEVELFRKCLSEGAVVADVGANIGCHSLAFSRIIGAKGYVFAFEPERNNFNMLCANIALNNIHNIYAYQQALGCSVGRIKVPEIDLLKTQNFGGLSLLEKYDNSPFYEVSLNTVDEVKFTRLDFIKIDVEGMEKAVLEGAEETIKKYLPLLYVENDRQDKSEELIRKLKSFGYVLYEHKAPLFNLGNYFENHDNVFQNDQKAQIVSINLFCHHESKSCPINPQNFGMRLLH